MKFRRIACDCCKSGDAAKRCTSPTYVISEVTDDSNVVFVLMNKPAQTPCRGTLALSPPEGVETHSVGYGHGFSEPRAASSGWRLGAPIDACPRPAWRLPGNDDFEEGETPISRNQRLLEEGSTFWPRRRNRDPDLALRDWE